MQKQCVKCGTMGNENDKYCTICGAVLQQQEQQNDDTTQTKPVEQMDTSPLLLKNYLLMFLITCVPIVNIIVLCIWAFGHEKNQNRKNFAKAALIFVGIGMVVGLVFLGIWFQVLLYCIVYGIPEYDLYDDYYDFNDYHYAVPEEEWWHNMELPDEAFSTVDTHIKQILIEENGVTIL